MTQGELLRKTYWLTHTHTAVNTHFTTATHKSTYQLSSFWSVVLLCWRGRCASQHGPAWWHRQLRQEPVGKLGGSWVTCSRMPSAWPTGSVAVHPHCPVKTKTAQFRLLWPRWKFGLREARGPFPGRRDWGLNTDQFDGRPCTAIDGKPGGTGDKVHATARISASLAKRLTAHSKKKCWYIGVQTTDIHIQNTQHLITDTGRVMHIRVHTSHAFMRFKAGNSLWPKQGSKLQRTPVADLSPQVVGQW